MLQTNNISQCNVVGEIKDDPDAERRVTNTDLEIQIGFRKRWYLNLVKKIIGVSQEKQKEENISGRHKSRAVGKRSHLEPEDLKCLMWVEHAGQGQGPNKPDESVYVLSQEQQAARKGFWEEESDRNESETLNSHRGSKHPPPSQQNVAHGRECHGPVSANGLWAEVEAFTNWPIHPGCHSNLGATCWDAGFQDGTSLGPHLKDSCPEDSSNPHWNFHRRERSHFGVSHRVFKVYLLLRDSLVLTWVIKCPSTLWCLEIQFSKAPPHHWKCLSSETENRGFMGEKGSNINSASVPSQGLQVTSLPDTSL